MHRCDVFSNKYIALRCQTLVDREIYKHLASLEPEHHLVASKSPSMLVGLGSAANWGAQPQIVWERPEGHSPSTHQAA